MTNDPTLIYGALLGAISAMAGYIVRISNERVKREQDISKEEREARVAIEAQARADRESDRTLMGDVLKEVLRTQQVTEGNISLIARAVLPGQMPVTPVTPDALAERGRL